VGVQQYGRDSFGDPDHVSIYGLKPHEWYARGVRILGRTAVECKPDRLADLIGRDVAAVARAAPDASPMVVDLFAGSGNTLSWIKRPTGARRAIGFELDDMVSELPLASEPIPYVATPSRYRSSRRHSWARRPHRIARRRGGLRPALPQYP
jgi:hypothetical protein